MRVEEIARKLALPENAQLQPKVKTWALEADIYSEQMIRGPGPSEQFPCREAYWLYYMLSHICPNLHHLHCTPNPWAGEVSNESVLKYLRENSPHTFVDENGTILQEGVTYTKVEYKRFISLLEQQNIDVFAT